MDRGASAADRRGAPARPRDRGLGLGGASGRGGGGDRTGRGPRELPRARPAPAFEAAAEDGEGPFTTDGVHFTDAGAEVVAGALATVIAELEDEDAAAEEPGPDRRA